MKNIPLTITTALLFTCCSGFGQKTEKVMVSKQDPYTLYRYDQKDSTGLFYWKLVPAAKPIGVLVILPSGGEMVDEVMKQITLHKLAVEKGFLVIFPSINWGTVKLDEEHRFLDIIFKQIVEQYPDLKDKFILGGLSGGGMTSLTYTVKANRDRNSVFIKPRAVFALDPPVDFANLYHQEERDVERNFSEAAVREGKWYLELCKKEFGGSPEERPSEYIKYSIYSRSEKDGGNLKYLDHTPLLIYTEPAIEWQIKYRHRDLYDLNCTDISAMINLLQLQGNTDAQIVVTHDKGVRLDGTIHPHSWSIMDNEQCLQWVLNLFKNQTD
jgi:hypothetical protein